MISSSAFVMVFNTAILTAFFGVSFDFVRVFIGLRRLGFSGHRLTRARLRISLCGLMLHANADFDSSLLVLVSSSVSSSAAVLSLKRHVSRLILITTGFFGSGLKNGYSDPYYKCVYMV